MANTIVMFDSVRAACYAGSEHLSKTFRFAALKSTWTPSIDSSTVASLTSHMVTTLSGDPATKSKRFVGTIATVGDITKSADGVIKFDLSNGAITASSGQLICAQYGLLFASANHAAGVPAFYWQMSTAEIVTGTLNITWPDPIWETSDNV